MKGLLRALALVFVLALLAGACTQDRPAIEGSPEPEGPSLKVTSPSEGETIKGNVVTLDLEASGIEIVKADGDTSGNTGHFHVFIDQDAPAAGEVIPKTEGIIHSTDTKIVIPGLKVGEHKFTVVFGDGTHARIGTESASVAVKVDGPSLDARAPGEVAAGEDVTVDIAVEGVTLVAADGDTTGATGHVHLFIDPATPPAADDNPIPKVATIIHSAETSVKVSGLAAGEHTIWVVLGDGAHVPFKPLVADKLVITVKSP